MNEEITFILVVEAIIAIAAIIAFFHLCDNVSQIKRKIAHMKDNFGYHFNLLLALGKKEEAKQYLIDTMISARDDRKYDTLSQIEAVIEKYSSAMEKVDLKVDTDFLEAVKQK